VIGDKGYVRQLIRAEGRQSIIPRREGAIYLGVQDEQKYQARFAIEHFFGGLKEYKRMTLCFDKLDVTFFSFFAFSCLKILKLFC
jgi:hypothetical protein